VASEQAGWPKLMRAGAVLWLLGVPAVRAAGAGAVGLDIGSSNSVVAVARRGGVDVVANEVSHRLTPSLVGFDGRMRKIGESAAAARTSSPGSVISACALVGLSLAMARRLQPAPAPTLVASGDESYDAAAEMEYCGERRAFSGVQLLAMLLRHLLDMADRDHGSPIGEAVVAVPARFTPAQRRAVLDATELAGTRCLGLVSDGAAVALDYALSRPGLPTDSDRLVAFVDAGYSGTQACVAAVRRGRVQVLAHTYAQGAGGEVRNSREMSTPTRHQSPRSTCLNGV
jgi:heat shock protein 4